MPHFFFERGYFVLNLLHAQRCLVGIQLHAPFKLLFPRCQSRHFRLRFRQGQVVRRELVLRRGLLRDQAPQRLVILLPPVALGLRFCQITRNSGRIVRSAARLCCAQVVLRSQKLALRLGEPRRRILYIQF